MLLVHARRVSRHALGLLTLAAVLAGSAASAQDLIITGVGDGPLTGGTPKVVEFYVVNTIADLSVYGFESANNGGGAVAPEFTFPAGGAAAGSFLYLATEVPNFTAFFGFAPTYTDGSAAINGDDAVLLYRNGAVIDVFGEPNVDGTGEAWEYLDGWAYRKDGTGPDATFQLNNFTYSGIDQLEGGVTNSTTMRPFPVGTYARSTGGSNAGTFVVTTPVDEDVTNGLCSLREAVRATNTDTAVADCGTGTADGDRITFAASATTINLLLGEIRITDDVTIDGSTNGGKVTVDGQGNSRIFDVDAFNGTGAVKLVRLQGLTLTRGNSGAGGSSAPDAGGAVDLKAGSGTVFTNVDVRNSVAGINGGGIHGGAFTTIDIIATGQNTSVIANNEARGNESNRGGGGVWGAGTVNITGPVLIQQNRASGTSGSGGGVFNLGGTLTIHGATITNNTANRAGGGIESTGGLVTMDGMTLHANDAGTNPGNGGGFHGGGSTAVRFAVSRASDNQAVEGGGLWISSGSQIDIVSALVTGNTATGNDADKGGGGFYNDGGRATISGTLFQGNKATGTSGSGGAILNNLGTVTVRNSTMAENTSNRAGGAIEELASAVNNSSSLSLIGVTIHNNSAGANPGNGGGLHVSGAGRVTIDSSRVASNAATKEGGAIWNSGSGSVRATFTSVIGNTAAVGAGLYQQGGSEGILIFRNGLVAANAASTVGGGLALDGGTVEFSNSTISGNRADTGAGAVARGGRLLLSNATVANNSATTRGGGLANLSAGDSDNDPSNDPPADAAAVSVDNSIVADNSAPTGPDLFGPIMSRGFNLFETTAGATIDMDSNASASTDITGVDPGLQPLANNGGPTQTQALSNGSRAINTGRTSLTIDQRGVTRRGTADIGAFESDAAGVANEDFNLGSEEIKISHLAPNPFRDSAELTFAVRESQNVRVVLYDVMGREVRVLLDGAVAGSTSVDLTVDGRGLASGVYVLVVRGETVQATRQITVAR